MVSIIIPLRTDQGYLRPCIDACFQSQNIPLEVIILPDYPLPWNDPRVLCEVTGPISPARKRNRGAALAQGDILAFIDDDTRPLPGWLLSATSHFRDSSIGAVGGPSITPPDDPFWARVSGAAYESWMLSAGERLRYLPTQSRDVYDFPSCNLLVRKSTFDALNGFGTDFWPGEDTEFCLALIRKGFRIRYDPKAVIEHHRRPLLRKHFVQLGNYALHRGYFAKRYPETSRRLPYFIPSFAIAIGVFLLIFTLTGNRFAQATLLSLGAFYLLLGGISLLGKPFRLLIPALCVIFLSHLVYGIRFLQGLIAHRLPDENRS